MSLLNENQRKLLTLIRGDLREATDSGVSGKYSIPLSPGIRLFDDKQLQPYTQATSHYDDAQLAYDSYDGSLDVSKSKANSMEKIARKTSKYIKKHPSYNDEDGDILNKSPGKINEISSSVTSGQYTGPIEIGLKKWRKHELDPFTEFSNHPVNEKKKKKTMKKNINRVVGVWEKGSDGKYDIPTHDVHTVNEDLAVWFGTKKKPKGSKQPKGPWVNICRKKDGKHPPCGRPEADNKGYPKCRAVGVAARMSDSQKKAACAQKRRVEKTNPKVGKGNPPKMASYKPKNESDLTNLIKRIIREEVG